MIYIGSDHRGFNLKEKIKSWLTHENYKFFDVGAQTLDPKDDYTVYAKLVAKKVQKQNALGVLICGSGVGVDVVANKFDGVRSSIGKSVDQVKAGRNDDNMNILVISSDFTKENETKNMIKAFLETKFAGYERYKRRLNEIKKIEETN